MEITIYSILIWITAIIIGSIAVAIFFGSNKYSSRAFVLMILVTMIWTLNVGVNSAIIDYDIAKITLKMAFFFGTLISALFVNFYISYPYNQKLSKKVVIILLLVEIIFFYLIGFTDLIIGQSVAGGGIWMWHWSYGPIWFIFDLLFFTCWGHGLWTLYKKWKFAEDKRVKNNLRFMTISLFVGIISPSITNIIMPRLGFYDFNWLGPVTGLGWVVIVAYSIIKYQQMSVKVVATEVLAIVMAIIFFVNIFTDFSVGIWGRIITFTVFVILGFFLIKLILRDTKQKELLKTLNTELQDLNLNLQQKVDAQTKEIKKSYEIEKRARVELQKLDQNKNDFIIITQHHLRTPLTQVRWYADSILKGLYGNVSTELNEAVSRIARASEKLTKTLNDFLAIAQLKIGVKVLNVQPISLKNIFETLLDDFSSEIKKRKIVVSFPEDENRWPLIIVDPDRIKDVFAIILDNAIQYNDTEGGKIDITTERKNAILLVSVVNTGIGLNENDRASLMKQSFFRTKEAKKVNSLGMGVGLLVAKTIIEAHKGNISIKSKGEGKEVRVEVKLPVA